MTDTVSHSVVVTAPTVIANDTFERTVTNGWGTADTGGNWTLQLATTQLQRDQRRRHHQDGGIVRVRRPISTGPPLGNVDMTSSFGYDKAGTGGGTYTSFVARRIGTSDYRVKVRVTATATTVTWSERSTAPRRS